jgi:diguanylate cyclase (GGDEF)-like protein
MPSTAPTTPAPSCRVRRVCAVALAAIAVAVLAGSRISGLPFSDAAMLACAALASAGFFRAGATGRLPRSALLLGWSAATWVAGVATWLAAESHARAESGLNGLSGGFMVAGSVLLLAGLLRLPVAPSALGAKVRLALDGVLAGASTLFVVWEPAVEPALRSVHRGPVSLFAALAIPVADVVCVTTIGALLWRSRGGSMTLEILFASAALRTLTDVRFSAYALGRMGGGDALIDTGWALSYALLAVAAVFSAAYAGHVHERRAPGRRLQALTYLPVGGALATAVGVVLVEHRMHGAQLVVLLVIAGLLVARQWITLNENRQLLQRVAFQAEHDDLTGLLNRTGLLRRLSTIVASGGAVRVHLIDLDRFKDVNDALGHPAGDELLVAVGTRLSRCVRGLQVARLGGDEFAVIDGRHDPDGLAERLLASIREPYSAAGRAIHLDASLGIAEWDASAPAGDHDRVAVDMLRDADAAMYAAKAAGGGARLFEDELRRSIVDRVALGRELRDALARGELSLAYQPVVNLRTGTVTHVEALARWNNPQRGPVSPGLFIPIAEASGLMPILGRWVLRTACAQAAAWSREGLDVGVCVNVSAQQLDGAGIVKDVSETLRRTRLAPGRLILELTESLFVDDSDAVRGPLEALRAAGSRIAIDDFGTGYSALSYLRRLPIDVLKLDRRFLAEIGSADIAVLTAILDLAHSLGLETIAEGIETPAQLALLRRLECGFGQGYHLARPMAAADVPSYLQGPLAHAA